MFQDIQVSVAIVRAGICKHHNALVFIIFRKFTQTPECRPVQKFRFDTVFLCEVYEFLMVFFFAGNSHTLDILGPRQEHGADRVFAKNLFHSPGLLCLLEIESHVKFEYSQGRHMTSLDRFNYLRRSQAQESYHLVARLPQLKFTRQHVDHTPDTVFGSMIHEQPGGHRALCKRQGFLVGADIGRKRAHNW